MSSREARRGRLRSGELLERARLTNKTRGWQENLARLCDSHTATRRAAGLQRRTNLAELSVGTTA